jgi:hypothetical protein
LKGDHSRSPRDLEGRKQRIEAIEQDDNVSRFG